MSLDRLAEIVNYSSSHLSRIEAAEHMPPPDLSEKLDAAFGTDGHFARLYGIARHEWFPDRYRKRMELEEQAQVIAEYAGHVVPGLLQTDAYARALFKVGNPRGSDDEINEKVRARLSRQAILTADTAPDLSVIMDEAAIRRPIGGPEVMRGQLAELLPRVDAPTSVIQVLPFAHGEHALLGGSLTLLTLAGGAMVAYEEGINSGALIEDPDTVSTRLRSYDLLRAHALSPRRTAALIRSAMEELPHEQHP
ncbi:helix-turn-helix transcriptional regulator [Streptomyces sp. ISL-99]|uniref:helix-turn-helix domain-containing protein n=1 Tax=Streptomyces sp. ISL-99 TaxID=2819193 RepID=UPI0027E530BC|nr:helix-turn-helix transcriptional regulator [Streptomyces sp. ISL-99]